MNRQEVIVIDEDEEEEVSLSSSSSDSDCISIYEDEDVEVVESSSREADGRDKAAPRIKRFARGRNDHFHSRQVEDSESDCEVLSAREWNEMFSKGKAERQGSLDRAPQRRVVGFERHGAHGKGKVGRKSLGTTLHRAQHGNKSSSSVKAEAPSPVINGSAGKSSSSPGRQRAKASWTAEPVNVSTPDRLREDGKFAAHVGTSEASPSAQAVPSGLRQSSSKRPVVIPRPTSGGTTPRKAPHIVHISETARAVPVDAAASGEPPKAANDPSGTESLDNETRQLLADSEPATAFDRETRRQAAEFREAEKLEWAARQLELQKQALEVQREKDRLRRKRKEAEKQLEMQSRQKQRVLEMRESQKKEEQVLGMKEELRGIVQLELERRTAACSDLGSLLQTLGILGACSPSAEQVNAGYKKALKTFHPDRAPGNGDLRCEVEAEETFKLVSRMKRLLPLTIRK